MSAQSSPVPGFTDEQAGGRPPGRAGPSPPLTMRLRRIHWVTLDYVLAAVCAVIIFGLLYKGNGVSELPFPGGYVRDWLPPVLAVCLSIPVAIRRRDPVFSLALVLVGCAAVLWLDGRITRGPIVPLALVLFLVAATRSRRAALAALAASLALCAVQGLIMSLDGIGAGNAIVAGLVLIIVWMVGYSIGQRRAYAARLRQQATDNAVTAERLRIARELHDVVAHSMTVVAVQAGFGEYVFDRQPAQARAALGAIQTVTGEALADMQRMLGALRQAGSRAERQARRTRLRAGRAARRRPAARRRSRRRRPTRWRPPRWRPRPAWPTWTGWWPARPGSASRSRWCGPGRPGPSRPGWTWRRSASSRRR